MHPLVLLTILTLSLIGSILALRSLIRRINHSFHTSSILTAARLQVNYLLQKIRSSITYRSHSIHTLASTASSNIFTSAVADPNDRLTEMDNSTPTISAPQSSSLDTPVKKASNNILPIGQMIIWFIFLVVLLAWLTQQDAVSPQQALHDLLPVLYVSGGLLLSVALITQYRLALRNQAAWPIWTWRFLGLLVCVTAAYSAAVANWNSVDNWDIQVRSVLLWLLAVIGALGITWDYKSRPSIPAILMPRREIFGVAGIIVLAFGLRIFDLDRIPYAVLGDETKYGLAAKFLMDHQIIAPFSTGADGHWNLYFMIIAQSFRTFGQTIAALRLPSVIAGTLSTLVCYATAHQLWGRRPAFIATALMATYQLHLQYSRLAINSIFDPLFLMLVFGWLWLAWRTGRRGAWLMAALSAGLSQYFFFGGRLVVIQVAVLGLFWLITKPHKMRTQLLNISLSIGVFLCVIVPIVYYAIIQPDAYFGSLNTKSIFSSGWLQATMQAGHLSEGDVLLGQLAGVWKAFVAGEDHLFYWNQSILTPIMALLALTGLLYCFRHVREGPYFWLLSSLGLIILFGGVLIVDPNVGGHRVLGSGPLIYIAIAILIDRVLSKIERLINQPHWATVIGIVLVGTLMLTDLEYYFVGYIGNNQWGIPTIENNVVVDYLADVRTRLGQNHFQVVCVGYDFGYCQGTTAQFLIPDLLEHAQIIDGAEANINITPSPGEEQILIVNSHFDNEVELAQHRYPTIRPEWHYGFRGDSLFVSFEVLPK